MKILFLGFAKIKYMPYANFYLDNIDRDKNEVHFLYWNRDLKEENLEHLKDVSLYEFSLYQQDEGTKLKKIKAFFKWRKFALKKIKEINPDFIIVLHTFPGVLLSKILRKKYKDKFIFDYRDSTYERFSFFKRIIHKLVKASKITFVSSDGFRKYLPESEEKKIFTSYNLLLDSLKHSDEKEKNGISSDKIRIAFWGFIRNENINREIIKKISANQRFELHYYGREQETALNLKAYAKELNAENVFFHGEYKPQDRYSFVRETDIIHNIYDDANMMLAMPNKYYDGIIFRLPQICMENSFMGKCVEKAEVGKTFDPYSSEFTDKIYEYYKTISFEKFYEKTKEETNRILREYKEGCELIKMTLS